jgi:Rrf2 family protein
MDMPKSFLAKILQKLARANIVKSYRGVKGGFRLARKPKEINLLEVIEAIQGPVVMNICALDKKMCRFSGTCTIHPVWIEVRKQVEKLLRKRSFASFPRRGPLDN